MPQRSGRIVILNGAPRSGKSSIASAIGRSFDGQWLNLGVDRVIEETPQHLRPGIGLRPGAERPDLEAFVAQSYASLYDRIAAHARAGQNIVVDVGHHDRYSRPLNILGGCARRLAGLPVLFVGVRCDIETILARRRATGYPASAPGGPIPKPVLLWQTEVHKPGIYDLEVDTTNTPPEACAQKISSLYVRGLPQPTAFERLATWCPNARRGGWDDRRRARAHH